MVSCFQIAVNFVDTEVIELAIETAVVSESFLLRGVVESIGGRVCGMYVGLVVGAVVADDAL